MSHSLTDCQHTNSTQNTVICLQNEGVHNQLRFKGDSDFEMRSQQVFTCKLRACVPLKTKEIKMSYKFSSFPSGNGRSEGMSDQEPLK